MYRNGVLVLQLHQEFCKAISGDSRVPGPGASASPGNLVEMQILGPHPRPREQVDGAVELSILCFRPVALT